MSIFRFRHSTYWPFFFRLFYAQILFNWTIAKLRKEKDFSKRMKLARKASNRALASIGYFSSMDVEQVYLDGAKMIPNVECHPQPDSYLHVITCGGSAGGHTVVLGRWIDSAPSEQKHSIVVLDQREGVIFPQWVKDLPEKHNGLFIEFNESIRIVIPILVIRCKSIGI